MQFETIIIVGLVLIVAGLIWMTLGLMDDLYRAQRALDKVHEIVSESDWREIVAAYEGTENAE